MPAPFAARGTTVPAPVGPRAGIVAARGIIRDGTQESASGAGWQACEVIARPDRYLCVLTCLTE